MSTAGVLWAVSCAHLPFCERANTSNWFEGLAVVNVHQCDEPVIDMYTVRGENDAYSAAIACLVFLVHIRATKKKKKGNRIFQNILNKKYIQAKA